MGVVRQEFVMQGACLTLLGKFSQVRGIENRVLAPSTDGTRQEQARALYFSQEVLLSMEPLRICAALVPEA
jgi:hypothetical protein